MSDTRQVQRVKHKFVEFIPEQLAPETLYISMEYGTVAHDCLCGCGHRVHTPLTPTDWHLTYDGETVSLSCSVGNWSFPCQSHYWIERSRVYWAGRWSIAKIEANRAKDLEAKRRFFEGDQQEAPSPGTPAENPASRHGRWWQRFLPKRWRG